MSTGSSRLSIASRYRLVGLASSKRQFVLATSHRHLSPFASLFRTQATADLITELTEILLARFTSRIDPRQSSASLTRVNLTTLENVRELWFELYDVVETWRNDFRINHRGARLMAVRLSVVMVHSPPPSAGAARLAEAIVGELIGTAGNRPDPGRQSGNISRRFNRLALPRVALGRRRRARLAASRPDILACAGDARI